MVQKVIVSDLKNANDEKKEKKKNLNQITTCAYSV